MNDVEVGWEVKTQKKTHVYGTRDSRKAVLEVHSEV